MKVDGNKTGIWDGFCHIVWQNKGKTICKVARGDDKDTFLSLNDCLKIIGYDGLGVCIVIFEDWTSGKVYKYGNTDDGNWWEHGTTYGFA